MYNHPDSHLCYKDSVHKDWIVEVVGETILGNDILVQDEITLTDSLCSKDDITLGCCESATLELKVLNTDRSYKDKTLKVSLVLDHHTSTPIPIGIFTVEEDELEDDMRFRKLKAYDAMYKLNTKDFATWFNNLPSGQAITCKDFRDSFFEYAGIEQVSAELINDWIPFTFEVSNSGATSRMLKEESEKVKQAVDNAKAGNPVVDYEEVDPDDEETWPPEYTTTEIEIYKWVPTYTEVQLIPEGTNPKNRGWYEYVGEGDKGGYIKTKDKTVKDGKKYYTRDNPENVNPYDEGWEYINDNGIFVPVPETETVPVENRQYYVAELGEIRSPEKYGWYEWFVDDYGPSLDDEIIEWKHYYEKVVITPETPKYVKVTVFHEGDNPAEKNWFEYDAEEEEYNKTTDTSVVPNKDYFEEVIPQNKNTAFLCLTPYIDSHRLDNPKTEGWYELVNDAYVKTEDETIDYSKDYYENIWEVNQNEEKDIVEDEILGSEIIQAICEINGCFGHITRDGKFQYIKLKPIDFDDEGLYPTPELYPDPTLYPQGQPYDELINRNVYEDVVRKDYYVKKIDRLVICKEDGDAGYVYPADSVPDNHNTYKITGNFIWYSFTGDKETLNLAGQNLLTEGVAQISEYVPCEIDMMGNPCLELGDTLKVHTRLGDFYTYVLNRTLSGSQKLTDSIEAKGEEKRDPENSIYDAVISLKGKANILTRSTDETRSEIIDLSEGLTSLIKQTADSITLSVSKEIKNTTDNVTEKFEAATKYTDDMIKDTVSKQVFNENNTKISEQFSEFERTYYQISATVEEKLDADGTGQGFKWELLSSGFRLKSKGGYTLVVHPTGNPSAQDWYEMNPETQKMEPTEDTEVEEGKYYYMANESSDYRDVFTCTKDGVWIENVVNTAYLNVRTQAIIKELEATNVTVNGLLDAQQITAQRIEAVEANIPTLVSQNIQTAKLNATNITSGTLDVKLIDVTALNAKIVEAISVVASTTHPNEGKIVIGDVKTANLYLFDGTDYKRVTTVGMLDDQGRNRKFLVRAD